MILVLLDEALTERLIRPNAIRRPTEGLLELGNRLVHEAHLLVRNAKVVMGLVVFLLDVFRDALLETFEHLLEVRLLVARRRLLFRHHARGLRALPRAQPLAEIDEFAICGRRAIERRWLARRRRRRDTARWAPHVVRSRLVRDVCIARTRLCTRRARFRRWRSGWDSLDGARPRRRRQRGDGVDRRLRARVVRGQLQHALVHGARLSLLPRTEQRVAELEVRIDQFRTVVQAERQLDALLVVANELRRQPNQLVDDSEGAFEIADALELRRDCFQLTYTTRAVAGFEKPLGVRALHFPFCRARTRRVVTQWLWHVG